MIRRIGLAAGLTAVTVLIAPVAAGAAVLYDQTDNGGGAFISSNDYGDSTTDQLADDFSVPPGQSWQISQVDAIGFVYGSPPAVVNVSLYASSGALPGSELFHAAAVPATRTPGGTYTIPLSGTPPLTPGTYWVSVQQTSAVYTSHEWFWQNRTVPAGNPAVYRNPGGATKPSCTDWTPLSTCNADPAELGLLFKLSGSAAPYAPPAPPPSNAFTLGARDPEREEEKTADVPCHGAEPFEL